MGGVIFLSYIKNFKYKIFQMAKIGRPKNTVNKAKHSKLMTQKKNKLKEKKLANAERLKAIIRKSKENS
jgi:hypothetical protein